MYEYEFRFVVQNSKSFLPLLQSYDSVETQEILYAKPHFRYRNQSLEVKYILNTKMIYFDNIWFKWITSKEIPFEKWSRDTCKKFRHNVGNFQDPFTVENRHLVTLDEHTKLFTFQESKDVFKLIFEWEYGIFQKPKSKFNYLDLLEKLSRYRNIYKLMNSFQTPPYVLKENIIRKPVKNRKPKSLKSVLYAHKIDGIFGLIYSYADKIKQKWENYERVIQENVSLGNGIVFAAEKLNDGQIYLLDVYQVQGYPTASWCRALILLEFLPQLKLLNGYNIQKYYSNKVDLPKNVPYKTDGIIMHDILTDEIFKTKSYNSIDLVYYENYFWLPGKRIPCSEKLKDGSVYEISTKDGSVIRERPDRFKGNNKVQLKRELKNGWGGPEMEDVPEIKKNKKRCK